MIKPNFNTADATPGSTHNDTLVALVETIWAMGAKSISLGERSYPPTLQVMKQKVIIPLMEAKEVQIINFDDLAQKDWIEFRPNSSHWPNGYRVARPIIESECLVSTCCLKTHQYGGIFTMSLKLHVGVVRRSTPWQVLLTAGGMVALGRDAHPNVQWLRGRRLRIDGDELQLQVDGDPAGTTPVEVELLPGAVDVAVPTGSW